MSCPELNSAQVRDYWYRKLFEFAQESIAFGHCAEARHREGFALTEFEPIERGCGGQSARERAHHLIDRFAVLALRANQARQALFQRLHAFSGVALDRTGIHRLRRAVDDERQLRCRRSAALAQRACWIGS